MNQEQVVTLMESATSEQDWNAKCDEVKKACGGYPDFWYVAIVMSGLAGRVANNREATRHSVVPTLQN